jgi:hypothetical protein
MTLTRTNISELQVNDIFWDYGMRLQARKVDTFTDPNTHGGMVYRVTATVLNVDDVSGSIVPKSWLYDEREYGSTEPSWVAQGNTLVFHSVETD